MKQTKGKTEEGLKVTNKHIQNLYIQRKEKFHYIIDLNAAQILVNFTAYEKTQLIGYTLCYIGAYIANRTTNAIQNRAKTIRVKT